MVGYHEDIDGGDPAFDYDRMSTKFTRAIERDQLEKIDKYVSQGLNVNCVPGIARALETWRDDAPRCLKIIRHLSSLGADPNHSGDVQSTPLNLAMRNVARYRDQPYMFELIDETKTKDFIDILHFLIKQRACFWDQSGDDDRYPMHWAVMYGLPDVVKLFQCNGTVSGMYDKKGDTPLHLVHQYDKQGDQEMGFNLVQALAKPSSSICELVNKKDKTLMDLSVQRLQLSDATAQNTPYDLAVIRSLLLCGAQMNQAFYFFEWLKNKSTTNRACKKGYDAIVADHRVLCKTVHQVRGVLQEHIVEPCIIDKIFSHVAGHWDKKVFDQLCQHNSYSDDIADFSIYWSALGCAIL